MNEQIKVEIPFTVEDLYLSGIGFLCCKIPIKCVLSDEPYLGYKYVKQERIGEKSYAILERVESK